MPTPHRKRMVEAGYAPPHHSEKPKKDPEFKVELLGVGEKPSPKKSAPAKGKSK